MPNLGQLNMTFTSRLFLLLLCLGCLWLQNQRQTQAFPTINIWKQRYPFYGGYGYYPYWGGYGGYGGYGGGYGGISLGLGR